VTYWSTPNTPTGVVEKNGNTAYSCNTTSPGTWIPAASGDQLTLQEFGSTPDTDGGLVGHFSVSTNGGTAVDTPTAQQADPGTPNQNLTFNMTQNVTSGSSYSFTAYTQFSPTSSVTVTSPSVGPCYFRYDATAPTAPSVTSTAYPSAGPTTVTAGGSGTISFSATDAASGVASYNYNLNTSSLTSTGEANTTATSLSIPLSSLHWGTNTLWLQAVDAVGNLSTVTSYNFYVQQSAFGLPTPGTAGDIDGDNKPDLVTIDAAGSIHIFSNPEAVGVDPTGDTTKDPNQYGGRVILPATANARWLPPDNASPAGSFIVHAGSFTGHSYDDLVVEQNGHLEVATNPGTPTIWSFGNGSTDIAKPACDSCVDYNASDWSSVTQMIGYPSSPGQAPDLLTVEVVNGKGTLWLYTPVPGSFAYNTPTSVSVYTSAWHWDDIQLIGAGPLPGTTGTTLWTRVVATGQIYQFHNIEAGITDPNSVKITVGSPYTTSAYPLMTTLSQADANGNLALWATDSTGHLVLIPTTTSTSGTTTVGTTKQDSSAGWASHELTLGSSYAAYNNGGIGFDNSNNSTFDSAGANTYALSGNALASATFNDPNTLVNDGAGGCPTAWTSCAASLGGFNQLFVPNSTGGFNRFVLPAPWQHRSDNYVAAGQVLPVSTPGNGVAAQHISFLGAATMTDPNTSASVSATITYTDGHTQTVTLTYADWTHNVANDANPAGGDILVATMDHRLVASSGASDATPNYLFMTPDILLQDNGAAVPNGVQIASVTLGSNANIHIFSIATS
jgi:hypothetical protein